MTTTNHDRCTSREVRKIAGQPHTLFIGNCIMRRGDRAPIPTHQGPRLSFPKFVEIRKTTNFSVYFSHMQYSLNQWKPQTVVSHNTKNIFNPTKALRRVIIHLLSSAICPLTVKSHSKSWMTFDGNNSCPLIGYFFYHTDVWKFLVQSQMKVTNQMTAFILTGSHPWFGVGFDCQGKCSWRKWIITRHRAFGG